MIEVEEYIRTPYHKIEKIKKIKQEDGWICVTTDKNAYELEWLKTNKVKHSKNIIDLIEVGDIVFMEDFPGYDFIYINDKEMLEALKQDVKDGVRIKSILTKKLYQANCYTVEQ